MILLRPILQFTGMFFDDSGGHGKAKPGAAFFGAKKRIEQSFFNFGRNAFAGIFNLNGESFSVLTPDDVMAFASVNPNRTPTIDAFRGVLNQVYQDLF